MFKKYLFIFTLIFLLLPVHSAFARKSIEGRNFNDYFLKKFESYDSVLIFTARHFYSTKFIFYGFAFKNKQLFSFTQEFRSRTILGKIFVRKSTVEEWHIKKPIYPNPRIELEINIGKLLVLSKDSLYDLCGRTLIPEACGRDETYNIISILFPPTKKIVDKKCYKTKTYQSRCPNADREYFIATIKGVESTFHCTLLYE